ncbi:hypothetical protein STEG23_034745, partial [Scotinomys teguina]
LNEEVPRTDYITHTMNFSCPPQCVKGTDRALTLALASRRRPCRICTEDEFVT